MDSPHMDRQLEAQMGRNIQAIWNGLADEFGQAWKDLPGTHRALVAYDVQAIARAESVDQRQAVRILSNRIGGAANLRSYSDCLKAGTVKGRMLGMVLNAAEYGNSYHAMDNVELVALRSLADDGEVTEVADGWFELNDKEAM